VIEEKIIKVKVFEYDDLSDEVKEKVLESFCDINVDYEWWDFMYEDFTRDLAEIGIKAALFSWDMGRGSFFYAERPLVVDERKLLKWAGWDLRTREARDIIDYNDLSIDTQHFAGGRAYNYFPNNEGLTGALNLKYRDFLSQLRCQYDYLTSRKSIEETIRANEYTFLEDGSQTIHI